MLIEYHRNMLADKTRNDAFRRALKKVIKKGKTTVADIGCGTGFIGFTAKKLGAKEVFMFESGPIIEAAWKLGKANRMKGCHFYHSHSTDIFDPPSVDVVVSETLGNYAFEENIIATLEDAKRFLKPGGTMIPQSVTHFACPVTGARFHEYLSAWDEVGGGIDWSVAKNMSLNNVYVRSFGKADLLEGGKAAQAWDTVDFRRENEGARRGSLRWTLKKSAVVYGVAVWWDCTLVPGVHLSTAPSKKKGHWEQLYFPVVKPVRVKKGDVLSVTLASDSSYAGGTELRWTVAVNGKKKQSMDLRRGYLA